MVINKTKPKEPESHREEKDRLLIELSHESMGVVALAYVYAKNFERFGVDVTDKWITTEQQNTVLEAVYKKGVDDTIMRLRSEGKLTNKRVEKQRERELQREKFLEKKRNNTNGGNGNTHR